MGLFGYLLQRGDAQPHAGRNILPPLLTFGFSIIIQNLLLVTFSADTRSLNVGELGTASIALGGDLQRSACCR